MVIEPYFWTDLQSQISSSSAEVHKYGPVCELAFQVDCCDHIAIIAWLALVATMMKSKLGVLADRRRLVFSATRSSIKEPSREMHSSAGLTPSIAITLYPTFLHIPYFRRRK
jgi:hypothetical protein